MPPTSSELLSALSHPLRRRILLAYVDGTVECASASELAAAMDQRVGRIAYHLKMLARGNILRPVQGDGGRGEGAGYGWTLGIEPEWLRVLLEVWAEADVSS
jgi:DNA-binding transcriptional ArsR family regulator